jgi:hypothetical protein
LERNWAIKLEKLDAPHDHDLDALKRTIAHFEATLRRLRMTLMWQQPDGIEAG